MADPRLQKTRWLLVHGGFPFDKETGPLLLRPNVYADVSVQDLVRSPTELAGAANPAPGCPAQQAGRWFPVGRRERPTPTTVDR